MGFCDSYGCLQACEMIWPEEHVVWSIPHLEKLHLVVDLGKVCCDYCIDPRGSSEGKVNYSIPVQDSTLTLQAVNLGQVLHSRVWTMSSPYIWNIARCVGHCSHFNHCICTVDEGCKPQWLEPRFFSLFTDHLRSHMMIQGIVLALSKGKYFKACGHGKIVQFHDRPRLISCRACIDHSLLPGKTVKVGSDHNIRFHV